MAVAEIHPSLSHLTVVDSTRVASLINTLGSHPRTQALVDALYMKSDHSRLYMGSRNTGTKVQTELLGGGDAGTLFLSTFRENDCITNGRLDIYSASLDDTLRHGNYGSLGWIETRDYDPDDYIALPGNTRVGGKNFHIDLQYMSSINWLRSVEDTVIEMTFLDLERAAKTTSLKTASS